MKSRKASETFTHKTEMVLPNDTNTLGNLRGGSLMHWVDIIAAISAQKACNRTVVTASVDSVDFKSAIKLGEIVILEAQVTRCFSTSMEVRVLVDAENLMTSERRRSNLAYLTFVAVDQSGNPIPVNPVTPETEDEKQWYEEAARRRELRLLQAGRISIDDATKLKKLFIS